jgi:hypothetical protein
MKLLLIFLSVCAWAKATRGGSNHTLYSAELQIEELEVPRPMADFIVENPAVKACLRGAVMKSGDDFSVSFSGQLSSNGKVSDVVVDHPYDSLRDCLSSVLPKLKLGEGLEGPFKVEISRVRTTPPTLKTFLLDLNDPKKFQ